MENVYKKFEMLKESLKLLHGLSKNETLKGLEELEENYRKSISEPCKNEFDGLFVVKLRNSDWLIATSVQVEDHDDYRCRIVDEYKEHLVDALYQMDDDLVWSEKIEKFRENPWISMPRSSVLYIKPLGQC